MANISMICHPATPSKAVKSISVDSEIQQGGRLRLRYSADCDPSNLVIPELAAPEKTDGLWQTTCFELFVRSPGGPAYFEFNFSPSTQWAAYRFHDYREGMADLALTAPEIHCDMSDTSFALETTLALPDFRNMPVEAALSAVVHETGDLKSYWALRHPPGKPDFHHADCFALRLAAPAKP